MRDSAAISTGAVNAVSLSQRSLDDRSLKTDKPANAASADLSALYPALIDADDRGDSQALAWLAWALFEAASTAQEAHRETIGMLDELRLAARVTAVGAGSPASLALLRSVLGKHGWLPPPDATPLQVLAAPL